jgi:ribosomal protein L29
MIDAEQKYTGRYMHHLFPIILLLAAFSVQAAPLYKWVDENGVTHFSEYPPEDQSAAESVDVRGIPSLSGQQAAPASAQNQQEAAPAQQPLIPEVEKVENPVKSPELCEQARRNIAQIQNNRRVRAPDPETGELRYLSEEEIATQLTNWQQREQTYCE